MKIVTMAVLLALASVGCRKQAADPSGQRIEERLRKEQEFARQQKEALERDKRIAEAQDRAAREQQKASDEALKRPQGGEVATAGERRINPPHQF